MTDEKKFPFDDNGSLRTSSYWYGNTTQIFKTADEARFEGKLKFSKLHRGAHSVQMILKEVGGKGRTFNFFLSDANKVVPHMDRGYVSGTFIPVKRGMRYAWRMENI